MTLKVRWKGRPVAQTSALARRLIACVHLVFLDVQIEVDRFRRVELLGELLEYFDFRLDRQQLPGQRSRQRSSGTNESKPSTAHTQ